MRRRAKVDNNHPEIVEALRSARCGVQSLAALGKGVPDLLVCRHGRLCLLEVKQPGEKLTPDENAWHDLWRGVYGCPVFVVRSVDEALRAVGVAAAGVAIPATHERERR